MLSRVLAALTLAENPTAAQKWSVNVRRTTLMMPFQVRWSFKVSLNILLKTVKCFTENTHREICVLTLIL